MIRRAFADLPERQVHYRHAGAGGVPLVMLHASPGSAKQLERLIAALAPTRRVIAPDTPGNGDSMRLPLEQPEIQDYAQALIEFLDALGLETVDIYGSHTGACIAIETAILAPGRVRRIVLDGIGLFSDAERDEYVANYAPAISPDLNGSQIDWAFMFCRDQYVFWPWYKRGRENARMGGLPDPMSLHAWTVEVLKSIDTYHLSYRAAFRHPARERLPLVTQPLLTIVAESDPLLPNSLAVSDVIPGARAAVTPHSGAPHYLATVSDTIAIFLDS